MTPTLLCVAFVGAVVASWALIPNVARLALWVDVLDRPDGRLKRQAAPVPYLGGLAVLGAFAATELLQGQLPADHAALLLGTTCVSMLGLIDDIIPLPWWIKLVAQLSIAALCAAAGLQLEHPALSPTAAGLLTIVWLVVCINALNLVDVADGVAGGVAAVGALGLGALALGHNDPAAALPAFGLAGACAGFLRFNRAPAQIYLGDAGSLAIGFVLGALALLHDVAAKSPLVLVAPLVLLGVPLLEVALVFFARLRVRRSPFSGSCDHFALRLRRRGLSTNAVAATSGAVSSLFAALATAMLPPPFAAVAGAVALLQFLALFIYLWRLGGVAPSGARREN